MWRGGEFPKEPKLGLYYEAKCLVDSIWADEEMRQQLSAMGRKQNIWETTAARLSDKCKYYGAA